MDPIQQNFRDRPRDRRAVKAIAGAFDRIVARRALDALDFGYIDEDQWLCRWRWPATNGAPVCPWCGSRSSAYVFKCRSLFKCPECRRQFSLLSSTKLHHAKMKRSEERRVGKECRSRW